jgi:transcriptional regulator PpsR
MAPGDPMADKLDPVHPVPAVGSPDLAALAAWAPELARTFVTLATDIALVIDDAGVVREVAQPSTGPLTPSAHQWVGRPWVDTVSGDTRGKIENLLKEVAATGLARRREVNHPLQPGVDVPVAYTAIRLGERGPVLAVGRDLRTIAAIQQRYIESQQDLERGYWRARQDEARYRLLFQVATDAVLVVDPETLLIVEANQAAALLFDIAAEHLAGRSVAFGFETHSRGAVTELLNAARASGQSGEIRARLAGSIGTTSVTATSLRVGDSMRLLVRVRRIDQPASDSALNKTLARLVDDSRDGVVVTDSSGRILLANPAFVELAKLADEAAAKGQALFDWLAPQDRTLTTLISQVRHRGIGHRIAAWIKPGGAVNLPVEVSAALLTEGDQECIGFTIHPHDAAGSPSQGDTTRLDGLVPQLDQLAGQIGVLTLPQLLERAEAIAERHFLQLALQRAGDDPAVAAALLGLSREGLAARRARTEPKPEADQGVSGGST